VIESKPRSINDPLTPKQSLQPVSLASQAKPAASAFRLPGTLAACRWKKPGVSELGLLKNGFPHLNVMGRPKNSSASLTACRSSATGDNPAFPARNISPRGGPLIVLRPR